MPNLFEVISKLFAASPPALALASATPSASSVTSALTPTSGSSGLSRLLGLTPTFHLRLLSLLNLGYKLRLRLPLFISAGFGLAHLFSSYVVELEVGLDESEDEEDDLDEREILEVEVQV